MEIRKFKKERNVILEENINVVAVYAFKGDSAIPTYYCKRITAGLLEQDKLYKVQPATAIDLNKDVISLPKGYLASYIKAN